MAGSYLLYNELHYNGLMTDLGLCRSPFFVEVSVETSAMTAGDVPALGKLNAAVQRVFYVGLAFAVKVEMKRDARIISNRSFDRYSTSLVRPYK